MWPGQKGLEGNPRWRWEPREEGNTWQNNFFQFPGPLTRMAYFVYFWKLRQGLMGNSCIPTNLPYPTHGINWNRGHFLLRFWGTFLFQLLLATGIYSSWFPLSQRLPISFCWQSQLFIFQFHFPWKGSSMLMSSSLWGSDLIFPKRGTQATLIEC